MADNEDRGRVPPGYEGGPASGSSRPPGLPWQIVLVLLVGACLSFYLMRGVGLSGDEGFYFGNSSHIAKWLLGLLPGLPFSRFIGPIVGNGWFLPGVSLLLVPVQLPFGGEAPVALARAWVIAVNIGLLAMIARVLLNSGLSVRSVLIGVSASFLVPFYVSFMGCLWGELVATHAAILFMLVVERRIASFGPLLAALCGAAVGAITLCRPQFFLLLALVSMRAVFAFMDGTIGGARKLCVGLATLFCSWSLVIAPWEWAIHARYGPFFLVVSTAEQPFVSDAKYRENHHLTGEPWAAVHGELVAEAARNNRCLFEQIRVSRRELARLSFGERVRLQAQQTHRFYFNENIFLKRFHGIDRAGSLTDWAGGAVRLFNSVSWRLWMVVGLLLMVFPFATGPQQDYRMPLVFKALAGMLALQPIVYLAHGRYYVSLIPLISIFASIALAAGTRVPGHAGTSRVLLRAAEAVSVALAGVTGFLLLYRC